METVAETERVADDVEDETVEVVEDVHSPEEECDRYTPTTSLSFPS